MFHRESDAGKRALHGLIERLRASGLRWMDIQMVTPVLQQMGGRYVSRREYAELLANSKRSGLKQFAETEIKQTELFTAERAQAEPAGSNSANTNTPKTDAQKTGPKKNKATEER
jgi:hypothetical protein